METLTEIPHLLSPQTYKRQDEEEGSDDQEEKSSNEAEESERVVPSAMYERCKVPDIERPSLLA